MAAILLSRISMIGFAAIAVYLTVGASGSPIKIGLSAYASIGMLAPGVFLAFLWPRASALGIATGILTGYLALWVPAAVSTWAAILPGWEPGIIAMAINLIVASSVSLLFGRRDDEVPLSTLAAEPKGAPLASQAPPGLALIRRVS